MNVAVDNLQVISSGSVVVKKDSEIRFEIDESHMLVMRLAYSDGEEAHIDVDSDGEGGLVFKCINFGVNDSSRGLKFPVKVLDLQDGSHFLIQFVIVGVGESRTLHYTWYKGDVETGNRAVKEEAK